MGWEKWVFDQILCRLVLNLNLFRVPLGILQLGELLPWERFSRIFQLTLTKENILTGIDPLLSKCEDHPPHQLFSIHVEL